MPADGSPQSDPDDDPVRASIAVTTSLIGLVRGFAAVLTLPELATMPRTGATLLALALPLAAALSLAGAADRMTATARRRALLLGGDLAVGAAVFAAAGFGAPCAFQTLGTAALAAALYGVPGVAVGAVLGVSATVLAVLGPAASEARLPFGFLVCLPTAYAAAALVAALVRHLQHDQLLLRRSLRAATWSAAQTQERARLARDLHDSLATTLGGIALCAAMVQRDPPRGGALAGEIVTAAEEAIGQARAMISGLRQTAAANLIDGVREVVARSGLDGVRTEVGPVPEPLAAVRAELLLVLSEALMNVRRHAGATVVLVRLSETDGTILLEVRDDGCGFAVPDLAAAAGRYGLTGMAERLAGVGGTFAVRSHPGAGTAVVARVPATRPDRRSRPGAGP